jgi:hypothetical protein
MAAGTGTLTFDFSALPLNDGTYRLTVGLHNLGGLQYDHWEQQALIEVRSPGRDVGVVRLSTQVVVEPGTTLGDEGPTFRS